MHVVFDGYWWVDGPISNGTVQREFILTWLKDFPLDTATVVVPSHHVDRVGAQLGSRARVRGSRLRPHGASVALMLGRVAKQENAAIVICHNFTPLRGPAVTFIHDALFQTNPSWFTRAERIYFAPIPRLARRALAVATSSRHEADRIRAANPRLRGVAAVGLGISPELLSATASRPSELPDVSSFVLTVGRLNVRKNLARTIDAGLDSGSISKACPLVVVGEASGRTGDLDERARQAADDGAVLFLSNVTSGELAWLYGNTRVFVCLALDEGWGFPPHEAESFGALSLVSDIPVFRESLDPARTSFVDPIDTAAISAELARLVKRPRTPAPQVPAGQWGSDDWSTCTARLRELCLSVVAAR